MALGNRKSRLILTGYFFDERGINMIFKIPATWQVQGMLEIEAESFEEAVKSIDNLSLYEINDNCESEPVKHTLDLEDNSEYLAELNNIPVSEVETTKKKTPHLFFK